MLEWLVSELVGMADSAAAAQSLIRIEPPLQPG